MSATASQIVPPPQPLPRLRRDLSVDLFAHGDAAFPAAIVMDPLRAAYFRLLWPESGMLIVWQSCATFAELARTLRSTFGVTADAEQLSQLVKFCVANQLTESDRDGAWQRLSATKAHRRQSVLSALLHNYLFFRVPLLRPERWLRVLQPWCAMFYARWFWFSLVAAAVVVLHLAGRQWPSVVAAAGNAVQLQGLATYAAALLVLKGFHELGHALTTVRQGCRVPSMGIAFMLGAPVFYTDTSDSWRLPRRSDRLAIVFAGVAAEMIVAVLALTAWTIMPDGQLRTTCFAIATGSIVLSLLVNINPFMRFDGYFALSDYLGVPNLQPRAFALAMWRLRELLFDLGRPPPEQLPMRLRRTLVQYAIVTIVYRLFLYLGIVAVVFVVAGKAIGIVLAIVEIVVFIARPIVREVQVWNAIRREIARSPRARLTGAVALGCLAAAFVPWLSIVEVPAVISAAGEEEIHLPFAARLTASHVKEQQFVQRGEMLFSADATDLERDLQRATFEMRALEIQVARLVVSEKEREQRAILESRRARAREKIASIQRRRDQLVIRAPFDGRIVDVDPEISPGIWLNEKRPLARIVVADRTRIRGMIADIDIARVKAGARATFVADDAAVAKRPLVVASIAPASDGRFSEPILADRHGGGVVTGSTHDGLFSRQGQFEVTFDELPSATPSVVRGIARIEADPISPVKMLWRSVARVATREHGF